MRYVVLKIAGRRLPYSDLNEMRHRLAEISPTLTRYGNLEPANFYSVADKLYQVYSVAVLFY